MSEPLVSVEVDNNNEKGLNHIVLHPSFEINGYIYLHYAVPGRKFNRVSRFTVNGDRVIPGSELIIIELDEMSGDIHNGGAMLFGFDGYLYLSTGDGANDQGAEDISWSNGKVLRMDDEGKPVPDNPWYDQSFNSFN